MSDFHFKVWTLNCLLKRRKLWMLSFIFVLFAEQVDSRFTTSATLGNQRYFLKMRLCNIRLFCFIYLIWSWYMKTMTVFNCSHTNSNRIFHVIPNRPSSVQWWEVVSHLEISFVHLHTCMHHIMIYNSISAGRKNLSHSLSCSGSLFFLSVQLGLINTCLQQERHKVNFLPIRSRCSQKTFISCLYRNTVLVHKYYHEASNATHVDDACCGFWWMFYSFL